MQYSDYVLGGTVEEMRCGCGLERMRRHGVIIKVKELNDLDRPIRILSWEELTAGGLGEVGLPPPVGHPDMGLDFRAVMSSPNVDLRFSIVNIQLR